MGLLSRLAHRAQPEMTSDAGAARWLVVGLGNPEAEYGGTRHNLGADVVRLLADRLGASLKPHKASAHTADTFDRVGGTPLSLAVPLGYMNNSGGPVQRLVTFYKVPPDHLIVVHDEIDLSFGVLRLKLGGGTAGHNGLKDVQRHLGISDFYRVRLGIGRPPGSQNPADFVLRRFSAKEREEIDVIAIQAVDAILMLISDGLEATQNRYH
jgi:peptidyl-tRNA hydrolase, PTH1 family